MPVGFLSRLKSGTQCKSFGSQVLSLYSFSTGFFLVRKHNKIYKTVVEIIMNIFYFVAKCKQFYKKLSTLIIYISVENA